MPVLHLGVVDIPYASPPASRRRTKKVASGTQTTGDVAGWLENKYGVMQTFFDRHQTDIAKAMENSYQGALETILMGGPVSTDAFGSAQSSIEKEFRKFLESGEIERLGIPGVPTQAAIDRRSLRFKSKRAKRQRPSFIDTGLYSTNFTNWLDDGNG